MYLYREPLSRQSLGDSRPLNSPPNDNESIKAIKGCTDLPALDAGSGPKQTEFHRQGDRSGTVTHAEFVEHVKQMGFHRGLTEKQRFRD